MLAIGLSRRYCDEQDDTRRLRKWSFSANGVRCLPEKCEVEFEPSLLAKKDAWAEGYFQQTAGAFADESIVRSSQGPTPRRDDW